jgi:hypothetical protein
VCFRDLKLYRTLFLGDPVTPGELWLSLVFVPNLVGLTVLKGGSGLPLCHIADAAAAV